MRRMLSIAGTVAGLVTVATLSAGCPDTASYPGTREFPRLSHSLVPEAPSPFDQEAWPWHYGHGEITGVGPEQPIAFPHYTHATTLRMECEYCHSDARKSIHGGVPSTQVCMNCHQYVANDRPEVQKVLDYWQKGEPIPWRKVHDAPDFVHFNHARHVQGGVQCTECHGQVSLQGQVTTWSERDETGNLVERTGVRYPMVRETTLQMGWCLDCHASHPSVDENYCTADEPGCEAANRRRAELKDCWTCHK